MLALNNNRGMTYQTDEKHITIFPEKFIGVVKLAINCYNNCFLLRVFTNNLVNSLLPLCGKNLVFWFYLAGLMLVVIFMRWSKYIENAKFCAESYGGGAFYQKPPHPF